MIKDRIQKFFLGIGEKLMAVAETRIKEQIPQILATVQGTVKEKVPEIRAKVEETVTEKGAEVATKVRTQAQTQIKSQLSGEKMIPRVETFAGGVMAGDGLVTTPFAVGFLASGGVGGALGIPFKFIRVVVLRPFFSSRMEVPRVRIDRNSKELGRALAALAAADKRLRRRRGVIGLFLPTFKKVVVLGGAGAAYVAVNTNGNRTELIESIAPRIEKVKEQVESTEIYAMIAPDIEKAVAQLGERVDAIR
ncbi:MAG: hypothetical protein M3065_08975 [Actinomycetota bacterium]|nr:hypothetical protein [Actinomycetota bacterium]